MDETVSKPTTFPNVRLMVSHGRLYSQDEADKELVELLAIADEVERLRKWHEDDAEWHLQFDVALTTYKAACALDRFAAIPTINAINALVNVYDDLER